MDNLLMQQTARIRAYAQDNFRALLREAQGLLRHPFIVPGSASYNNCLWDWDSWLTDVALRQLYADTGADAAELLPYEQGCILNFLEHFDEATGRMPICITPDSVMRSLHPDAAPGEENTHKPCLAQHAAFVARHAKDALWLRPLFGRLQQFIAFYDTHCRHSSGLYFWIDDFAIGVDNDPCTFYRPRRSSGSIFLNSLMLRELRAMAWLAGQLALPQDADRYTAQADALAEAIRQHCWDERDGFFYSVDLNLLPVRPEEWLHSGCPRHWDTLLQRIDVWSGFLPLWAGAATPEQARRCALRAEDARTFSAEYGIRTLSRLEKMYRVVPSGNPSCWLGPVWGVSNYLTWSALRRCGCLPQAKRLAEKTVRLFAEDLQRTGALHEYYDPDTGEGVINPGFQNWNLLAANMIAWLEGRPTVEEF